MNYTQNYQLPQWAETDRILRTDFNDAFDTIEDALSQHDGTLDTLETDMAAAATGLAAKGNCQVYRGSYVGTGTLSCSVSLPGQPALVVVMGYGICLWGMRGAGDGFILSDVGGGDSVSFGCSAQSASWSASGDPRYACNASGKTYRFVAFLDL